MIVTEQLEVEVSRRTLKRLKEITGKDIKWKEIVYLDKNEMMLFSSRQKIDLRCDKCGSSYIQKLDRLMSRHIRFELCGNCLSKMASEKMKITVRTEKSRLNKSKIMKKFHASEEGIASKKEAIIKWRKWLETKEGKKHLLTVGDRLPHFYGEEHHNWNPDKDEFSKYKYTVQSLTNKNDLSILENFDKNRGLCGVDGAYQLDHIMSIKYGFDNNIDPELISSIENLQFIPWKENRSKGIHCLLDK